MKFWLSAFVLLFVAVELFDWVTQLGSLHDSGIWLLLGGMGLAALSNAKHLSTAPDVDKVQESVEQTDKALSDADSAVPEMAVSKQQKVESLAEKSAQDSISFKVRPLKR